MIALPYFSENDVFLVLGVMALSAKEDAGTERKSHFMTFARHVALLLQSFPPFTSLGHAMADAFQTLTASTFDASVMSLLLSLELERRPTANDLKEQLDVLGIARAGSCSVGVCI